MEKSSKKKNKTKKKRKNPFEFFVYDFIKWTGAPSILLWFRLKCYYENKAAKKKIKGPAVVCANHLGFTDPIILSNVLWYRRPYFVATSDLFGGKFKTWLFKQLLCIPIDRDNIGVGSFKDIVNVLKNNGIVGIFPEGHINNSQKDFDPFKGGMVLMAMQGKAPIVPMVILKRKWWQRKVVLIGEPINLPQERMNLEQINQFSEIIREKEEKLLSQYNERRKTK